MLRRLLPIALLLAGIAAAALLFSSRPTPLAVEVQETVWIVALVSAQPQRLSPTLTLYAQVASPRAATLRAAINADVIEVPAREGDPAKFGGLLVKLDPSDAQLQLSQCEADVAELHAEIDNEDRRVATDRAAFIHETTLAELAHRGVERAQRLAKRDLGSAAVLDESQQAAALQSMSVDNRRFAIAGHQSRAAGLNARLARAQSQLAMAHLDLQRTQIRAPFDARITSVNVAPGDRVRVGDALVEVFDPQAIELRAQVPSDYLPDLRTSLANAQPASAIARVGNATVRAHLDRLSARVERGRAGADALFRVYEPTTSSLELGRTVQLRVSLPAVENVIPIPAEALYGVDQIYLLIDSRMRAITVQRIGEHLAADGSHSLLVKSDELNANSKIIATQLPSAVDGLKVRTVN
jgi:multidrug efflux pump subunit AcrA (membrane-fusion protein)